MSEPIAFIGLGAMGGPMALNIIKKGTNLSVYDIEKEKMQPHIKLGAVPGNSIKDTVEDAEIIVTMLPSTENVKSVITDPDGVLSYIKPGSIILDMSTIAPTGTDEIYEICKQKDIDFIDAPVGRLVSCLLYTSEALTLAQKIGLDLNTFKEVNAGTTANNGQFHINFLSKVLKNDIEPGFTIDLAHKDMGLAIETANSFRVGLPVGSSVQAVYGQARSGKFAKKDFSALLDYACELAEVDPPRIKKS